MAAWKFPEYKFHPLSERYPLPQEADLKIMGEGMQKIGFPPQFAIVIYAGMILEGRSRYLAAKMFGIRPCFVTLPKGIDPEEFIRCANENRRHLSVELLAKFRSERIERIAKASEDGKSTREIAKDEHVSQMQVRRDLQEKSKTTSNKSETYVSPEKKPDSLLTKAAPLICETCKRKGIRNGYPGCAMCAEAREQAKISKKVEKELEKEEEPEEWNVEEAIKKKNNELEAWCRSLMEFVDTMPTDPWLNDLDRRDSALQKLKNACDTIRSAKCHCKCPRCKGDGCAKCYHTGRVTKYAFDQMGAG